MRYGLIEADVVVQVQPDPGADGQWVELPDGITNGCRLEDGAWIVPEPEENPDLGSNPLAELLIEKGTFTRQEWEAKQAAGRAAVARLD